MPQTNKFLSDLASFTAKKAADLYLVQIENLPVLTLAKGHKTTNQLLDKLCKDIGAYRLMSDQIYFFKTAGKPAEVKKTIADTNKLIHKLDTHISCSVSHLAVEAKQNAEDALNDIYSRSSNSNNIFSAQTKKASNDQVLDSRMHIELANQIKSAISEKKFKLAYQPIIEAKTGNTSHYEALLRIADVDGTLKSAGSFIPIAEKMGLIDSIDLYVLERAIEKLKQDKNFRLALNISNLTIGNRQWLKTFFDKITADIGARMVIEITETTALRDLKETAYFIATLQDAGCMFALDDFGSGYTSFRQIRALSFDYIKIDGSLISDIATNQHNRLLVKSLLEYMHGMGIKTVAEFVENGETAKILMEYGIGYMQGNYFGKAESL